jgi:hypothetical protein
MIFRRKQNMVFSSILIFWIEIQGIPINFIKPGDSPRKTASASVKISKRNDTWLI